MRAHAPSASRLVLSLSLLVLAVAGPARADPFWAHWGDGKAELDGYALSEPRYGQTRAGTAVMIFVTEDMSDSLRVKADPGRHPPADVHPVLKLNFVRTFQTGVYDYKVLQSVFARVGDRFGIDKITTSVQEWCGAVYQHWVARGTQLEGVLHSYFDGEADQPLSLPLPEGGLAEDALPIVLRGLRGDFLPPGGSRTVPLLPSALRARFEHKPQAWGEATITRAATVTREKSALGTLDAFTYTVAEKGGPTVTFTLEAAWPHRILSWRSSSGEAGTLLGSARLAYWQLHDEGGEKYLSQIGLPLPARAPLPRR